MYKGVKQMCGETVLTASQCWDTCLLPPSGTILNKKFSMTSLLLVSTSATRINRPKSNALLCPWMFNHKNPIDFCIGILSMHLYRGSCLARTCLPQTKIIHRIIMAHRICFSLRFCIFLCHTAMYEWRWKWFSVVFDLLYYFFSPYPCQRQAMLKNESGKSWRGAY